MNSLQRLCGHAAWPFVPGELPSKFYSHPHRAQGAEGSEVATRVLLLQVNVACDQRHPEAKLEPQGLQDSIMRIFTYSNHGITCVLTFR